MSLLQCLPTDLLPSAICESSVHSQCKNAINCPLNKESLSAKQQTSKNSKKIKYDDSEKSS